MSEEMFELRITTDAQKIVQQKRKLNKKYSDMNQLKSQSENR